jgi:hypothetical protein
MLDPNMPRQVYIVPLPILVMLHLHMVDSVRVTLGHLTGGSRRILPERLLCDSVLNIKVINIHHLDTQVLPQSPNTLT